MTLADPPHSAGQPVNFKSPPVTEVVLAIQFERPVVDLEVLADFTAHVKADFPRREQYPSLPPMVEDFSTRSTPPAISVELTNEFTMPRTWFLSSDEALILQLQEDRFVFNWRRADPDDATYPRYQQLREWFRERLGQLVQSIEGAGRELPGINLCEVTYVNQLAIDITNQPGHPDLGEVLSPVVLPRFDFLPRPEDQQYRARFRIPGKADDDLPLGRFYVNSTPAFRPDGMPMYILTLTGHLIPRDFGHDETWHALDLGREWVVKGFVDLTTKRMHECWGYMESTDD